MEPYSRGEAAEPATPARVWDDFVEIFFAPASVFRRRTDGRFWPAIIVLTLVSVFLFLAAQNVLADVYQAEFDRELARTTAETSPVALQPTEQMRSMSLVFGSLALLVVMPVGTFVIGGVIWVLTRGFGSAVPYAVAVVIAVYSEFPVVIQWLAMIAQGLVLDPATLDELSLGPVRFLDRDSASQLQIHLFEQLDLFAIWSTILVAVGVHVAARLPKARAALVAVLAWCVALVPGLLMAMIR